MNITTLREISGLISEAKNKLDEMEVSESDEDTKANWIYELDNVESELDIVIEGIEQRKF